MIKKKLYEKFHTNTRSQLRIISNQNFTYHIIIEILRKYISDQKNILDLGCGAGTIALYLASNYKSNVLGVDVSSKAVHACKESARLLGINNIKFEQINFPTEIPKGKFDVIVCLELLEHLDDDNTAVKKMYEMLNFGGLVILSTPSLNAPLHKLGYTNNFDRRVGHLRRYNSDMLIQLFNNNKLKVISIYKKEGIIRNLLFINPIMGKFIRFIKYPVNKIFNAIDHSFLSIFGESDIIIVAKKS